MLGCYQRLSAPGGSCPAMPSARRLGERIILFYFTWRQWRASFTFGCFGRHLPPKTPGHHSRGPRQPLPQGCERLFRWNTRGPGQVRLLQGLSIMKLLILSFSNQVDFLLVFLRPLLHALILALIFSHFFLLLSILFETSLYRRIALFIEIDK